MATYSKFQSFVEAMAEKVHNLGSDQIMIALTDTAPLATNTVLANITEISYTNLSSRVVTTTSSSQTSGTYKLVLADLIMTASTGNVGPFRYIVLYNNTATNKELIAWFDRGNEVTLDGVNGDTLTADFDGSAGVLTIT